MPLQPGTTGVNEGSVTGLDVPSFYTGNSHLGLSRSVTPRSSFTGEYGPNETTGANVEVSHRMRPPLSENGSASSGSLDKSLLKRAKIIIDSFDPSDVIGSAINTETLRGIVLQLWESATNATLFHQEILAAIESAVLSVESPSMNQLSAFKEAIMDLGSDVLAQAHLDVIRRRFIAEGFNPLALLSQVEDGDDCD